MGVLLAKKQGPADSPSHRSLRNLTFLIGYLAVTFVAVLAVLTVGLFWDGRVLWRLTNGTPAEFELVNLAGRQRMLSEQLVKEVLLSGITPDAEGRRMARTRAAAAFVAIT